MMSRTDADRRQRVSVWFVVAQFCGVRAQMRRALLRLASVLKNRGFLGILIGRSRAQRASTEIYVDESRAQRASTTRRICVYIRQVAEKKAWNFSPCFRNSEKGSVPSLLHKLRRQARGSPDRILRQGYRQSLP